MDMFNKHPLLVVKNTDKTEYEGLLGVGDKKFLVSIRLAAPGQLKGASIDCEWHLRKLLQPNINVIQKILDESSSLVKFLSELQDIAENQLKQCESNVLSTRSYPPPEYYEHILAEIEELGWNSVSNIDSSFTKITLAAEDGKQRQHFINIEINNQAKYPEVQPLMKFDLPELFQPHWTTESSLLRLYLQFKQQLTLYQEFWNTMDEIDAQTKVLLPKNPSRSWSSRRIALDQQGSSIEFKVHPLRPKQTPFSTIFQGPGVEHFKKSYNDRLGMWNDSVSLLTNLQSVLKVNFPPPIQNKEDETSESCIICYEVTIGDELPDQICEDKRCAKCFHASCLYEWLSKNREHREQYGWITGECPHCKQPIKVKEPTS